MGKISKNRTINFKGTEQISFELSTVTQYKYKVLLEQKAQIYKIKFEALTVRDLGWTCKVIGEYVGADFATV